MARYTQELTILLNGEQARASIEVLQNEIRELDGLIRQANARGDRDADQMIRKRKALQKTLQQLTSDTRKYNEVTRNLNGATITQLEKAYRSLRREIRNTPPDVQAFVDKSRQLEVIRRRIAQLNGQVAQTGTLFSRMSDRFNRYFGVVSTAIASVTGLSLAFRSAAESAAEMDDLYADVMKTTGLTREEVAELNEEFKKIDTRTPREALNNLARDAGKLGISTKKDVLEFVRAADKINVALGEDLGEGAIRNIGKIADVFGLTMEMGIEKSLLSIGSAINALGQDSSAAEAYLVDFTQRLAGVGAQTGMTVQDLLGYASGLDQSAMKVEMAATAFQTFVMNMFNDVGTFAKYAGMEVSAFSDLLVNDVNTAIMTVLTSLNEAGGFQQLVPIFKDMGADGARAVSVLASIASNIEAVRQAQVLSNEEFENAISIDAEFATKNNNRMAELEKARKRFRDEIVAFGESLSPVLLQTTKVTTLVVRFLASHGKAVVGLAASYAVLLVSMKAYEHWSSIVTAAQKVARTSVLLLSAAYNALTGNVVRAKASMLLLKKSFSGWGLGILVASIAAVTAGIVALVRRAREGQQAMRSFFSETERLKNEAGSLLTVLENAAAGSDLYRDALKRLQELYGPYINNLINEKGELQDVAAAREAVNRAIEASVGVRIRQEEMDRVASESLERQSRLYENMVKRIIDAGRVSEETARMVAKDAMAMIKEGKGPMEVYQQVINTIGGSTGILGKTIRQLSDEYGTMLKDIEKVSDRFQALIPGDVAVSGTVTVKGPEPAAVAEQQTEDLAQALEDRLALMEAQHKAELNATKRHYLAGQMTQKEYQNTLEALTIAYLQRRNDLYTAYGQDNADAEQRWLDAVIARNERQRNELERLFQQTEQELQRSFAEGLTIDVSDAFSEEAQRQLDAFEELKKKAEEVKNQWSVMNEESIRGARERYRAELQGLEELMQKGLITYTEYLQGIKAARMTFAGEVTQVISNVLSATADLASSLQSVEMARLETQMNRELAMYGDTADKRAEIENKYEQKRMEMQMKYADLNMAIQISQALAAGALATVQAWTAAGGNPVIFGIISAMIGATTALQVAAIVAQRNAMKSQTSSSASSSVQQRDVLQGYSEGGYTPRDGNDRTPVGVVHANEWVAPAAMIRAHPSLFASLESLRLGTSHVVPAVPYASGGYVAAPGGGMDSAVLLRMTEVLDRLDARMAQPLESYVVLSSLERRQRERDIHKKAGTR